MTLLRLEADDPEVLRLTGLALQDSISIPEPPLMLVCRGHAGKPCGKLLARVGDTGQGALFTSSWIAEDQPGYSVTVDGHKLHHKAATRWVEEHGEELAYRHGAPMRKPGPHGVRALLKPGLGDYPDLLVQCDKGHGDAVLNRHDVVNWLRQAVIRVDKTGKPMRLPVTVTRPERKREYRAPQPIPGAPSRSTEQHETISLGGFDPMPLEEFERWRAENYGRGENPGAP